LFPVGNFENILGTPEPEDVTKNKGCKMKNALIKKNVGKFPRTYIRKFCNSCKAAESHIYDEMFSDKNKEVISHT
jgi:hypothetical protein